MVRGGLLGIGAFSVLIGLWQIGPAVMASTGSPAVQHSAARLALLRSDLYASAADRGTGDAATSDAARAVRLSPLRSHAWLQIAEAFANSNGKHDPEGALTMAFFTGSGQAADARSRVTLATTALSLDKPELCDLLRSDLDRLAKDQDGTSAPTLGDVVAKAAASNRPCLERLIGTRP
jgi:hypothetical protein